MSQIGLEEWDRLDDINAITDSYLETRDCLRMKQQIAKTLLGPQSAIKHMRVIKMGIPHWIVQR
jgi:hypothetical protein